MDTKIEFSIKLRKKDIANYAILHYFKAHKALNIVFLCFMILLSLYRLVIAFGNENGFEFPVSVIFYLVLYIAYIATLIFSNIRIFTTGSLNKYDNKYTITEQSIIEESLKNKTVLEWGDVRKVCESKKLFAFYISNSQAYLFPKDQLENNTIIKIRSIVSEKVEKKKRKMLKN